MAIDVKRTIHDQPSEDTMAFKVYEILVKDAIDTRDDETSLDSLNYSELAVLAYDISSAFIEVSKQPVEVTK